MVIQGISATRGGRNMAVDVRRIEESLKVGINAVVIISKAVPNDQDTF